MALRSDTAASRGLEGGCIADPTRMRDSNGKTKEKKKKEREKKIVNRCRAEVHGDCTSVTMSQQLQRCPQPRSLSVHSLRDRTATRAVRRESPPLSDAARNRWTRSR